LLARCDLPGGVGPVELADHSAAGNQAFRSKMFEIVRTKASVGLREKIFNDDFEGLVIYVNHIPQTANPVMEGIFISDARPEKRQPPGEAITIVAERGWLISDPGADRVVFRLENGGIHVLSRDFTVYQRADFRTHDLQLNFRMRPGKPCRSRACAR
jgi:lipopolysaccharide export system permease protein